MNRLCIISHTEHYYTSTGELVGLASTVQEINYLLALFDEIVHVAVLHPEMAPNNTMPYASERITFVAIPPTGGTGILAKLKVLYQAPKILSTIQSALNSCDVFQFRAPTGIGVYVLPWLIYGSHKKGWYKYAGNWKQPNAPWSYRWQRWLLVKQSQWVTINGVWPDQPSHCLSFENPCLADDEYSEGQALCADKVWHSNQIELCFVGRLEKAKGVELLLHAVHALPENFKQQITKIHIVGQGAQLEQLKLVATDLQMPITFYGLLNREQVHRIYKQCHAIVLPSASEGFPKVIAEAMNYGCVPVVSNVSALSQYITHGENGFLLQQINADSLRFLLQELLEIDTNAYKLITQRNNKLCAKFTYSFYNQSIKTKILSNMNTFEVSE